MTADPAFLAEANEKLSDADVLTVLRWAHQTFGQGVSMTTAFGYSGLVLLHHALGVMPDMKVYFIDTGFHFPQTLAFCRELTEAWKINLQIVRPETTPAELVRKIGPEPHKINADLCCHYCKVEPLLRFIHNHDAWLSGIRRDQSNTRAGVEVVELDGRGVVKISPMARWTKQQTWDYIRRHKLPYHPLHDQGYPSIGCQPCTAPVAVGSEERDGRWPFMQKVECGIHLRRTE